MDNRETGRLKTYDVIKGYGFIQRERGQDVFVNFAEFEKSTDAAAIAPRVRILVAPIGPEPLALVN